MTSRATLLGEYNSTGGIVNETVYLGDTPVAVLTGTGGATVYSVSADWLNTPHIIQNASKQNVWTWDHYAFGDNAPNQNPSGLGAFTYNLRFPGQYEMQKRTSTTTTSATTTRPLAATSRATRSDLRRASIPTVSSMQTR